MYWVVSFILCTSETPVCYSILTVYLIRNAVYRNYPLYTAVKLTPTAILNISAKIIIIRV